MRKIHENINPQVEVTLRTGDPIILFTSSVGAVYFIQALEKGLDTARENVYKLVHTVNAGTYTMRELKYSILTYQTTHQTVNMPPMAYMPPDICDDIFYIQMFEHYQTHPNYGTFIAYGVWKPNHQPVINTI